MLEMTGPTPAEIDPTAIHALLFPLVGEMPPFHPAMSEVESPDQERMYPV